MRNVSKFCFFNSLKLEELLDMLKGTSVIIDSLVIWTQLTWTSWKLFSISLFRNWVGQFEERSCLGATDTSDKQKGT